MATTTNYGWTTPDDSSLVKDGASAIRTLGSSVDTTVKALSPGTTAGDVDYYTSSTAKARLAIGTTGQVLTVAGGVPSWATSTSGSLTLLSTTTINNTVQTYTISSLGGYKNLLIVGTGLSTAKATYDDAGLRLNGDTGNNYTWSIVGNLGGTASRDFGANESRINLRYALSATASTGSQLGQFVINIYDYSTAGIYKAISFNTGSSSASQPSNVNGYGSWLTTDAITSITIKNDTANNLKTGTIKIWGVN
jgi:hypothetical protein